MIKTVKNTLPWIYVISDPNDEEIVACFNKNELEKANQIEFRVENVIKKKGEKKNATGVNTLKFAKKTDLASLKSQVDKLDIDKLEKVPNDSNNLKSKVDKLDVHKKPVPVD